MLLVKLYAKQVQAMPLRTPRLSGTNWLTALVHAITFKLYIKKHAIETVNLLRNYPPLKVIYTLQQTIAEYGVPHDCLWNVDETGFRIGTGTGNHIVTFCRKRKPPFLGIPENKEYFSNLEAISAN